MSKIALKRALFAGIAALTVSGTAMLTIAAGDAARAVEAPTPSLVAGNPNSCEEAGLEGEILLEGEGDASNAAASGDVSADGLFLDVTVNEGFTATGIVVKGGDNANVYEGNFVGPVTIENMRAPQNMGGQQPQISHWFVCGEETPVMSPTPPTMSPTPSPTMSPTPPPTMSPTPSPTMSPASPSPSVSPSRPPRPTPSRTKPGYGY